jgi:hypothetical protein
VATQNQIERSVSRRPFSGMSVPAIVMLSGRVDESPYHSRKTAQAGSFVHSINLAATPLSPD